MWQPTHVQVTVQRVKGVLIKGKNDTNDAFVVIALGKEKFQTSIKERSFNPVEWHEECDLEIPRHGNTAALQLTVYHRNALGMDEFLGQVSLPLSEFDVYERPRTRTYKLLSKPDKGKKKAEKDRGELEVKIAFIVKSGDFLEPGKKEKHKSSLTSLKQSIGGSLLSLGGKDKQGLKKFTKSVSSRMDKLVPKRKKINKATGLEDDYIPSQLISSRQWSGQADPGVISDEEDELGFDDMKLGGGGNSTANSSPYSITSRASSRHKPQALQDDESLGGLDYPPPQVVHQVIPEHDNASFKGTDQADDVIPVPPSPIPHSQTTTPTFTHNKKNTTTPSVESTANNSSSPPHSVRHSAVNGLQTDVVGSLEHLSSGAGGSSRSSLNNSCASSTHDLHPTLLEHSGLQRLPEVKALTLERSTKFSSHDASPDSNKKKQKRKGFKSRIFSKSGGSREIMQEEYQHRVVEGGNDKLPNAPLTNPHSRLSQEIHNKFVGKSREDLMDQILTLQTVVERQVHHSKDLEEYIDNLLLRVLDASPHLLQAPTTPQTKSTRSRFMRI